MAKTLKDDKPISLVTCTGDRLAAFTLCHRWMMNQWTVGNKTTAKAQKIQWVVVDDGPTPVDQNLLDSASSKYDITYVRPTKLWVPGRNTMRRNTILGLRAVKNPYIAIIEDDDYYQPNYLIEQFNLLDRQKVEAVGEGGTLYYHLPTRTHKRMFNLATASLCQTVFTAKMIPLLIEAANTGNPLFDINFWNMMLTRRHKIIIRANTDLCIGIKGMPGRGNITAPQPVAQGYINDGNLLMLKKVLKSDAEHYTQFLGVSAAAVAHAKGQIAAAASPAQPAEITQSL